MTALAVIDGPALRVFDAVPAGHCVHAELSQRSLPLLRPGEVAVVDEDQTLPIDGELFLIEYSRSTSPTRQIVQLWRRQRGDKFEWWAGAYNRPRSAEEAERARQRTRMVTCVDGPYPDLEEENGWYLPSLLIGRVVGLYRGLK